MVSTMKETRSEHSSSLHNGYCKTQLQQPTLVCWLFNNQRELHNKRIVMEICLLFFRFHFLFWDFHCWEDGAHSWNLCTFNLILQAVKYGGKTTLKSKVQTYKATRLATSYQQSSLRMVVMSKIIKTPHSSTANGLHQTDLLVHQQVGYIPC